jgi:hypothetical protein
MKTSWTKGLEPLIQEEIVEDFKASGLIRERLTTLLMEKVNTSRDESRNKSSYDNPNWTYLQADARGYERALYEVISLLEP